MAIKKHKEKWDNKPFYSPATKKGHVHKHGQGFITIVKHRDKLSGGIIYMYKHRPNWNVPIPSNNERVVAMRKEKNPNYFPVRGKLKTDELVKWVSENKEALVSYLTPNLA